MSSTRKPKPRAAAGKKRVVVVSGDRFWADGALIEADLAKLPAGSVVYEGECPVGGADILAREAILGRPALRKALTLRMRPARWGRWGAAAGPKRNAEMLAEAIGEARRLGLSCEVWAYHDDLLHSAGTADMVRRARAAAVAVTIRSHAPVQLTLDDR